MKKIPVFIIGILLFAIVLAIFISPFASSSPDGLEKVAENKKILITSDEGNGLKAPLPDYTVPGIKSGGTSVAGAIGTIVTFIISIGIAFLLKKFYLNKKRIPEKVKSL